MTAKTKTTIRTSLVTPPEGAQNDGALTDAQDSHAQAVNGAQGAAPRIVVETQYPLFRSMGPGGVQPSQVAVHRVEGAGAPGYVQTVHNPHLSEKQLAKFGAGTYRLELRDAGGRVVKGGHSVVQITEEAAQEAAGSKPAAPAPSSPYGSVEQLAAMYRREAEEAAQRRKQDADNDLRRLREESAIRQQEADARLQRELAAADAKYARELAASEARRKDDLERERLRYENDRARDREQLQFMMQMQSKSTELVVQALASQKTDATQLVTIMQQGLQLGMQAGGGNPEMEGVKLMGKGLDALTGAFLGGGEETKQLEQSNPQQNPQQKPAQKKPPAKGSNGTGSGSVLDRLRAMPADKRARIMGKLGTILEKADAHGVDAEQAVDAFLERIEEFEQGGDEGDEETTDERSAKPARERRDAEGPKANPVAERVGGDGNGAGT